MRLLSLFFICGVARPCQASDIFVRAMLPNPPGSDALEWILLEREPGASFSAEVVIQDGLGATQTYSFLPLFVSGDQFRLMKAESGLSLNNDADWVEIWQEGDLLDKSETYPSMAEGFVWTRLGTGWQSLSPEAFAIRLADQDWDTVHPSPSPNPSPTPELPTVRPSPRASPPLQPPSSSPQATSPTTSRQPESAVATIQPSPSAIPYQEWLAMPRLFAVRQKELLATSSARPLVSPPAYPQLDGEGERHRFYDWQKRAILGAFGFLLAGVCFVLLATPALCRWYNDKQCIW
jgi:hypothetical protein